MTYLVLFLFVLCLCVLLFLLLQRRKAMESHQPRPDNSSQIDPSTHSIVSTTTTKTIHLPKAVKVTIAVKRDEKGNSVLVAEPREVTIDEGVQVAWTCPDGKLEIR